MFPTHVPHRFEARILEHPHVVGRIVVCDRCGMVAQHCAGSRVA